MTTKNPRNLIELGLEGLRASREHDFEKASNLAAEVGVRSYLMGEGRGRQQIDVSEVQPGDWLQVRQGAKAHHGVCVGQGQIVHATAKHGVIKTSLDVFSKGESLALVRRCETDIESAEVVENIEKMLGQPYNVFKANCEHLASKAHTGSAESNQLERAGFAVLVLAQFLAGLGAGDTEG